MLQCSGSSRRNKNCGLSLKNKTRPNFLAKQEKLYKNSITTKPHRPKHKDNSRLSSQNPKPSSRKYIFVSFRNTSVNYSSTFTWSQFSGFALYQKSQELDLSSVFKHQGGFKECHIPASWTGIIRFRTVQNLVYNFAFLQRFYTTTGRVSFWGGCFVAHFVHIVRSWPRRTWAAAPVVSIIDAH